MATSTIKGMLNCRTHYYAWDTSVSVTMSQRCHFLVFVGNSLTLCWLSGSGSTYNLAVLPIVGTSGATITNNGLTVTVRLNSSNTITVVEFH